MAAAALLGLASPAGAQPGHEELQRLMLRHCSRLIWQFDGSTARPPYGIDLAKPRAARDRAERLCNHGQPEKAIPLLEGALYDIGVNPLPRP